jgi:hypothetical protein
MNPNITLAGSILQSILALIPQITNSKAINTIIAMLVQILPVIIQEAQDLLMPVKNIIAALSSHGQVTPDQLAMLDTLDQQIDAAYDAAWAAYIANHPTKAAQ